MYPSKYSFTTVLSVLLVALCMPLLSQASPFANEDFLIPTAKSISRFEQRVAKNPKDFHSAVALARLYMRQAREADDFDCFLQAEKVLRNALVHSPGKKLVRSFLAESLMAQHRFHDAKKIANQLLAEDAKSPMPLATLGDASMQLGEYEDARVAYQSLLENSKSPAVLVRMARYQEVMGDMDKAIQLATTALKKQSATFGLKSVEGWYHWRLAKLHLGQGQPEKARGTPAKGH